MNQQDLQKELERTLYRRWRGPLVSRGMRRRTEEGVLPGCAPVGYLNGYIGGEKAIIVDPLLAPLVKEAFRLSAEKQSLRKILAVLTPKGLVSRNGKPMGPSALQWMLRNPFYTGRIRYYGKLVPGRHLAIVEDETFVETQLALRSKNRR